MVGGRPGDRPAAAPPDGFQAGRTDPEEVPHGSLVSQAANFASKTTPAKRAEDGVSLNQWIAAAVAEKIGVVETAAEFFKRRAGKVSGARLIEFLRHAPDVKPEEEDQIRSAKQSQVVPFGRGEKTATLWPRTYVRARPAHCSMLSGPVTPLALPQTSPFEVCDAPKGHLKERRSALASMPDRSAREIADPTNQGRRQPAGCWEGTKRKLPLKHRQ
jgi:hypothetical protein